MSSIGAPDIASREAIIGATVGGLADILKRAPRVHGLTNTVAQTFTANVLLAVGAIPTMTSDAGEVVDFVAGSDALYVNLGTLDATRRDGIGVAARTATAKGVPWVLDPAHCDASRARIDFALALLASHPSIIRLNEAERSALELAMSDADMALTGKDDVVCVAGAAVTLSNGHPHQARVTAIGCAGTALVAAFLAVGQPPFLAAAAGITALNIAAELAAERSVGPGTFAVHLVDCLYDLREEDIRERLRLAGGRTP